MACCPTSTTSSKSHAPTFSAKDKLPTGKVKIEVETTYVEPKPAGPLKVVLKVNGEEVASGVVPVSAPLAFTANDALDFGIDLGSPVGIEYYDQAPFKFNGKIEGARVEYLGSPAQLEEERLKRTGRFRPRIDPAIQAGRSAAVRVIN